MFRRILFPVDGSTFAEHALPYVADIARRESASVHLSLVHTSHTATALDPEMADTLRDWDRSQRERQAEYLKELAVRLQGEAGTAVEPRLLDGEVVPVLEREVRTLAIDLVVMTTHGRGGLERAWLGSVADALVRHLEVPVLLITPSDDEPLGREEAGSYRHVVVALDGSERAERSLRPALALAGSGVRVTLLRVVSPPAPVGSPYIPHAIQYSHDEMERRTHEAQVYVDELAAALRHDHPSLDIGVAVEVDPHPARAILAFAKAEGAGLIAVTTHGRSPVTRLLMGSVTDKVVRAATVPVLVC